ncbi:MAG: hypothetical protein OJF59_001264 [Cytophagales bacterium]|jgi:hypothetical protein|nr:hypothetical protein [Bacteroidota bacterium]MBS1981888.1 hypothetical protein [Bacteroidota bacterium]WHZ07511.1 MAG: hypothetical protein OJF59_001264 [Cytophagales bacterium]
MKALIVFSLLLVGSLSASAQVIGKTFPDLTAETVDDKKVNLPQDVKGKFTLLGLAYSKKSEDELNTWFNPIFSKFIQKTSGALASMDYNVNVYFVPMFTGINAAATGTAKRKAAKNVDAKLLPYLLFYKGSIKKYKDELDFDRKDIPYFFVLDTTGKIVYATDGVYSDEKMDGIESVIDN